MMKPWQIILIVFLALVFAARALTKNNFHEVIPGEIYRSAQLSATKLTDVVEEHGIQTVISLRRPRAKEDWYINEKEAVAKLGIGHHDIAMDLTFSPRIDHLLALRDLIETAPKPLLVHCRAGADRTGLASVMTKLLDGTSSLEEARAQISWKFYVFRDNSLGIPFFDEYVAWLDSSGLVHSKDNFNHWLENDYLDLSGNVHFLVDQIHGQLWRRPWGLVNEGHEFRINRADSDRLELSGWAFDTRNISLLKGLEVYLGDVRFENSRYGIHQGWLIKDFHKEQYLDSGWKSNHPLSAFTDGCYDLRLKFIRKDDSSWETPPAARICIH